MLIFGFFALVRFGPTPTEHLARWPLNTVRCEFYAHVVFLRALLSPRMVRLGTCLLVFLLHASVAWTRAATQSETPDSDHVDPALPETAATAAAAESDEPLSSASGLSQASSSAVLTDGGDLAAEYSAVSEVRGESPSTELSSMDPIGDFPASAQQLVPEPPVLFDPATPLVEPAAPLTATVTDAAELPLAASEPDVQPPTPTGADQPSSSPGLAQPEPAVLESVTMPGSSTPSDDPFTPATASSSELAAPTDFALATEPLLEVEQSASDSEPAALVKPEQSPPSSTLETPIVVGDSASENIFAETEQESPHSNSGGVLVVTADDHGTYARSDSEPVVATDGLTVKAQLETDSIEPAFVADASSSATFHPEPPSGDPIDAAASESDSFAIAPSTSDHALRELDGSLENESPIESPAPLTDSGELSRAASLVEDPTPADEMLQTDSLVVEPVPSATEPETSAQAIDTSSSTEPIDGEDAFVRAVPEPIDTANDAVISEPFEATAAGGEPVLRVADVDSVVHEPTPESLSAPEATKSPPLEPHSVMMAVADAPTDFSSETPTEDVGAHLAAPGTLELAADLAPESLEPAADLAQDEHSNAVLESSTLESSNPEATAIAPTESLVPPGAASLDSVVSPIDDPDAEGAHNRVIDAYFAAKAAHAPGVLLDSALPEELSTPAASASPSSAPSDKNVASEADDMGSFGDPDPVSEEVVAPAGSDDAAVPEPITLGLAVETEELEVMATLEPAAPFQPPLSSAQSGAATDELNLPVKSASPEPSPDDVSVEPKPSETPISESPVIGVDERSGWMAADLLLAHADLELQSPLESNLSNLENESNPQADRLVERDVDSASPMPSVEPRASHVSTHDANVPVAAAPSIASPLQVIDSGESSEGSATASATTTTSTTTLALQQSSPLGSAATVSGLDASAQIVASVSGVVDALVRAVADDAAAVSRLYASVVTDASDAVSAGVQFSRDNLAAAFWLALILLIEGLLASFMFAAPLVVFDYVAALGRLEMIIWGVGGVAALAGASWGFQLYGQMWWWTAIAGVAAACALMFKL